MKRNVTQRLNKYSSLFITPITGHQAARKPKLISERAKTRVASQQTAQAWLDRYNECDVYNETTDFTTFLS